MNTRTIDAIKDVLVVVGIVIGLIAVAFVLVGVIVACVKPIAEASCNQQGEAYSLPADYRLMSDTCYVTLSDGRQIDVSNIRAVEPSDR